MSYFILNNPAFLNSIWDINASVKYSEIAYSLLFLTYHFNMCIPFISVYSFINVVPILNIFGYNFHFFFRLLARWKIFIKYINFCTLVYNWVFPKRTGHSDCRLMGVCAFVMQWVLCAFCSPIFICWLNPFITSFRWCLDHIWGFNSIIY